MATTISSAYYSFIRLNIPQYGQTECYPPIDQCLPIFALEEIAFQLPVGAFDHPTGLAEYYLIPVPIIGELTQVEPCDYLVAEDGQPILDENGNLIFTEDCSPGQDECTFGTFPYPLTGPDDCPGGLNSLPEKYARGTWYASGVLSDENIIYFQPGSWQTSGFPNTIPVGQCFRFIIVQSNVDINLCAQSSFRIGCTNCFVRVADTCDTTLIRYINYENAFAFNYSYYGIFANQVRLPFYLRNAQFPSTQKSYQKSDGSFIKLSERIDKEYELETDWMPEVWHEKLKIALAHDAVILYNENARTDLQPLAMPVVNEEPYEIEWSDDIRLAEAKGRTRVKRSVPGVGYVNSNCQQ